MTWRPRPCRLLATNSPSIRIEMWLLQCKRSSNYSHHLKPPFKPTLADVNAIGEIRPGAVVSGFALSLQRAPGADTGSPRRTMHRRGLCAAVRVSSAARSDHHGASVCNGDVTLNRRRCCGAVRPRNAWIGPRSGATLDRIAAAVAGIGDTLGVSRGRHHRNGAGGD
jgi:hypothetical protein